MVYKEPMPADFSNCRKCEWLNLMCDHGTAYCQKMGVIANHGSAPMCPYFDEVLITDDMEGGEAL